MEIIVSGACPECGEDVEKKLTDALTIFAKTIIENGYKVTFGAHPTFEKVLYKIADDVGGRKMLQMYISRKFLDENPMKETYYTTHCQLKICDKKSTTALSLTEMRKKMIQRDDVIAVVCIGGKIKRNKDEEGIREEIRLARNYNIPVFVVGSVGGCSAEVSEECEKKGWDNLNDALVETNELFKTSSDYLRMVKSLLTYINDKKCIK